MNKHTVYEAVPQASEYVSPECHEQYRKRNDQLSFRNQLVEGLLVKCANVLECKLLGSHSSKNTVP